MPGYLSAAELTRINAEHAAEIKQMMRSFLLQDAPAPQPMRQPAPGEDPDYDAASGGWRSSTPRGKRRSTLGCAAAYWWTYCRW